MCIHYHNVSQLCLSLEDFVMEARDEVIQTILQSRVGTKVNLEELYSSLIPSSRLQMIEKIGQGEE